MATKNFIQLVDIPDYRFDKRATDIDYDGIAVDCDSKTISILSAINHISLNVFSLMEEFQVDKEKITNLSCIIADLAELAIATNKIAQSASYLSGLEGGNDGA